MSLLIVLIALIIDLSIKGTNPRIRPCYAGYLSGCSVDQAAISRSSWANNPRLNQTKSFMSMATSGNQTYKTCYNIGHIYDNVLILRGTCWLQNGFSNLIFFGLPIGIIIIVNAIFYVLTIMNVHGSKNKQKKNNAQLRRFSKVKLPVDQEFKFYIQMGVIMGFTWIIGFFLIMFTKFRSEESDCIRLYDIIYLTFTCIFILLNSSTGVFIFFAFIFRKKVKFMYLRKWSSLRSKYFKSDSEISTDILKMKKSPRSREVSQNSSVTFADSLKQSVSTTSTVTSEPPMPSPLPSPSISVITPTKIGGTLNVFFDTMSAMPRLDETNQSDGDDYDEKIYI
jgi:hypothetical protein